VLSHPTLDQLHQLGLAGMAQAFAEIEADSEAAPLTHAEWLGLLLDREVSHRRDRRLAARLRYARLRHQASVEDVDYRAPRGLDRALFKKLAEGAWIDTHDNLILCGPTGIGKSWLAAALGHKACRDNRSVLYQRIPKLFADLALARGRRPLCPPAARLRRRPTLDPRSMPAPATTSSRSSKNATADARRSSPARSRSTNGTR
jgi:DNA replication protein DnaC